MAEGILKPAIPKMACLPQPYKRSVEQAFNKVNAERTGQRANIETAKEKLAHEQNAA